MPANISSSQPNAIASTRGANDGQPESRTKGIHAASFSDSFHNARLALLKEWIWVVMGGTVIAGKFAGM